MIIYYDENGYITGKSEKNIFKKPFIEVDLLPEKWYNYKVKDGKLVLDENLQRQNEIKEVEVLKQKFSKLVSIYIKEVLNYFDYDDLADLMYCKNVKIYEKEAKALSKWVDSVYESYEEIIKSIESGDNVKEFIGLLPKFKG